ncbi:MAG: MBL fold metallo-hydrolase, partial [Micrococcales bacterium]
GADVLLAEASFAHGRAEAPGLHLTGRQAGQVAGAADAGVLVLTHIPPWNPPKMAAQEAVEVFDGPIETARAGMQISL